MHVNNVKSAPQINAWMNVCMNEQKGGSCAVINSQIYSYPKYAFLPRIIDEVFPICNNKSHANRKINKPIDWWECDIDFIIWMSYYLLRCHWNKHIAHMKIGRHCQ